MSWLAPYTDVENCYVTTFGRRSGNPHEIEIWFGVDGDALYLISGNGPGADWFRNAQVTPVVSVRIEGETWRGTARVVIDADERRRMGERMGAKYPWDGDASIGLTFDMWCFDVPMLAVDTWSRPAG